MFKQFKKNILSIKELASPEALLKVINSIQQAAADSINPMISKIQNDSVILSNVTLTSGKRNTINHLLNRNLQGWKIIRQRAESRIWDQQDHNPSPNLTLWLWTANTVVVDIEVF